MAKGITAHVKANIMKRIISWLINEFRGREGASDTELIQIAQSICLKLGAFSLFPTFQLRREQLALAVEDAKRNPNSILLRLMRQVTRLNTLARERVIQNLAYQFLIGGTIRAGLETKGQYSPTFVVISPTIDCQLNCQGCYAAHLHHLNGTHLSYSIVTRLLDELYRDFGSSFVVFSGGEPTIWQCPSTGKGILDVCHEFPNIQVMAYSNGIKFADERFADHTASVGNFMPAISIEGNESFTVRRRGPIWQTLNKSIANLRARGVVYGASVTATRANAEFLASSEFLDFIQELGFHFTWMFLSQPVGSGRVEDMPTVKQRAELTLRNMDAIKQGLLIIDFWGSGYMTQGCISGRYGHILPDGSVTTCVFKHFRVAGYNVHTNTLAEIFNSPAFRIVRELQATDERKGNLWRPCAICDHPDHLRHEVVECGEIPLYPEAGKLVDDGDTMSALNHYALDWKSEADAINAEWKLAKKL